MRGFIGALILLPFVGTWLLAFKVGDACIRRSYALRPLGILFVLVVGAGSLFAGYYIGPIVGWLIMGGGGFVIIVGIWRCLAMTRADLELEEQAKELEKRAKQFQRQMEGEMRALAQESARGMLAQGRIDDYEEADEVCRVLDQAGDPGDYDLENKLKRLKKKQLKVEGRRG